MKKTLKAESKFAPIHTMKAFRGRRGLVPIFLKHDTDWR
jgi:hypothetical protein